MYSSCPFFKTIWYYYKIFLILFQIVYCYNTELLFIYWPWILQSCWLVFYLVLIGFFGRTLCIQNHVICEQGKFYFFSNLDAFYFYLFICLSVWLPWLEPPVQCWIVVVQVDILILLLILGGKHGIFDSKYCVGSMFFRECLFCGGWECSFLFWVWLFLSQKSVGCFFYSYWDDLMVCFCSWSLPTVYLFPPINAACHMVGFFTLKTYLFTSEIFYLLFCDYSFCVLWRAC